MTKKEAFVTIIKKEIFEQNEIYAEKYPELFEDAYTYFLGLNAAGEKIKGFTNNGKLVLGYMQENKDNYNNLFKAKEIGEGLGISSRTVSGAMRKLVSDSFVEKIGTEPTVYCITDKGIEINLAEV